MIRALAGLSIALTAGRHSGLVNAMHGFAIRRLECKVRSPRRHPLGCRTLRLRHEKLIHPKETGPLAAKPQPERVQHGDVKALAPLEIRDDELDMIDQTAAVTKGADRIGVFNKTDNSFASGARAAAATC